MQISGKTYYVWETISNIRSVDDLIIDRDIVCLQIDISLYAQTFTLYLGNFNYFDEEESYFYCLCGMLL